MVDSPVEPGTASHVAAGPRQGRPDPELQKIEDLLDAVKDPEIPVLSIRDLGILRRVEKQGDRVIVTITPTYSGCPAMDTIRSDITKLLRQSGYADCEVKMVLAPAWTSDWISDAGRSRLEAFGIAPPTGTNCANQPLRCPRCKAEDTRLISEFGSTACKAMYQCNQCLESFGYFKAI